MNIALQVFRYQALNNEIYRQYLSHLRINPDQVTGLEQIPFLPISFFREHTIKTGAWHETAIFASSGTTGARTSKHYVKDVAFYHQHTQRCFGHFFGDLTQYHFLALLPSYIERKDSSLISMMQYFVDRSGSTQSGFYLGNYPSLLERIKAIGDSRKVILWGVSFALLDLAEKFEVDLSNCMIFETGGMKGRRREIVRAELHEILRSRLNVSNVYSEYGMTELLSQAYTLGKDNFTCPPWMKIIGREVTDPFNLGLINETAGINIIDLANWHSIAFIETEDLGRVHQNGTFEILGRMDNSDMRGCNLLVS